jgi:hypothetical protein
LIARQPEQRVPLDEHIEIDRIQIPPRWIR